MKKESLNISPSFEPALESAQIPAERAVIERRVVRIVVLAVLLGAAGGVVAMILQWLIALITHLAFYGEWSLEPVSPAPAVKNLGWWVITIPVVGGLVVGVMARVGSRAIRGHGIPEAMEQVLTNRSRIPIRLTFLKPLSSAVAIGTGGPFGAEGPIIATGGALGSMLGQLLPATAAERRTLLAAGAAAGMAATFGTPVSAVLLAVELLLFEYRARSIIPVAFAAAAATAVRYAFGEGAPVFAMPDLHAASAGGLAFYVFMGGLMGLLAAMVTRAVYAVEDAFERLPIHWMWWPAVGAVAVGIVGYFAPDTLGVGYYNITTILSVGLSAGAIAFLCGMKLISWLIALGSGTSGGTLAPLFTIGGGAGVLMGMAGHALMPRAAIDLRVAALVGMATIFAGASRAFLASTVFAFEATLQPAGLLPLLGGCAAAYLVSGLVMRNTIMTEKIARRGVRAPTEYGHDPLDHVMVRDIASRPAVTLRADEPARQATARLASPGGNSHQGFPVVDEHGVLVGVVMRRGLETADAGVAVKDLMVRPPRFIYDDCTARQAVEHMVNHAIGRLPVVERDGHPPRVVGMITRSDILACYRHRMDEERPEDPTIRLASRARARGVK